MKLKIKNKISKQQKIYYEKNRDELLQKQNERNIHFKEFLRNYFELENRSKTLKEKTDNKSSELNDSEDKTPTKSTFTITMVFKKLNNYTIFCKWHSLTIHVANFAKDS